MVAGAPQYLLNLLCGAPARSAIGSGRVVWAYREDPVTADEPTRLGWHHLDATDPRPGRLSSRLGLDAKPVTVTYTIAGVVLWIADAAAFPAAR